MKRPFGKLLAFLIFIGAPFLASAQFNFTIGPDGTAAVTKYTGPGGDVVIPFTFNGLPVTGVGETAFLNNSNLVSITIPEGVTSIGNDAFDDCGNLIRATMPDTLTNIGPAAFAECTNLVYATIPPNVVTIGYDAFANCFDLEDVSFPETVTSIGAAAYFNCHNLGSVTIPSTVTNIGLMAFGHSTNLTAINVDGANPFYSSANGVLFDKNQTILIEFPAGLTDPYTIPSTVTNIGVYAFSSAKLGSIVIPGTVSNIAPDSFQFCSSLTNVLISEGVASIGNNAFQSCGLTSLTIPDSVTNFYAAFDFCSKLTNVFIGSGSGVGSGYFSTFDGCSSLAEITVDSNNPYLSSMDGVLFDKTGATLVQFPPAKGGNYTMPYGVSTIEDGAFSDCSSLTSVIIPNTVTNVEFGNFEGCLNLTGIYFMGNAPAGLFTGIGPLYGETNLTFYYLPGATGWGPPGYGIGIPGWVVTGGYFNGFTNIGGPITVGSGNPTSLLKLAPWVLPYPVILNPSPSATAQSGGFGFIVSWATNKTVVVDASTTLDNPVWQPLQTNSITNGWILFNDPQWSNYSGRFYRTRAQ